MGGRMKSIFTINVILEDYENGHRVIVNIYFFKWLIKQKVTYFFRALIG